MFAIVFCLSSMAFAQVSSPVSVNLGIGGGLSMPSGDFSNGSNSGYHGLAKVRVGSLLPLDITGAVSYHHFGDKIGSDATNMLQIAAGFEYAIPSIEIKPYLLAEFAVNSMSSTRSGASSYTREGVNLGAGVQFMGLDGSVKYQILNMMGKEDQNGVSEPTANQITLSVAYMFGL